MLFKQAIKDGFVKIEDIYNQMSDYDESRNIRKNFNNDLLFFNTLYKENGKFYEVWFVMGLLQVSRQRIYQLVKAKRLKKYSFFDSTKAFITGNSIKKYLKDEKKSGRPRKQCKKGSSQ